MPSDWRKDLKQLYFPPTGKVVEVLVPELTFLAVEGRGNPNQDPRFQGAVGALYSLSYTLKFSVKKRDAAQDFKVGPLEALWWNTETGGLETGRKEDWSWKAMILQPSFIDPAMVDEAREAAAKRQLNPFLQEVKLLHFQEGRSAQTMHIGPWDKETENILRVKEFIQARGGVPSGHHHEVYMSDPRRVPPEKLKTVIRQPFR